MKFTKHNFSFPGMCQTKRFLLVYRNYKGNEFISKNRVQNEKKSD